MAHESISDEISESLIDFVSNLLCIEFNYSYYTPFVWKKNHANICMKVFFSAIIFQLF